MRTYALYLTSITTGFCMMSLELLGGRILAPDFGSGIDVWAAIISVFILSLSIGYWLGGRIADRSTTNRNLGWLIVAAGLYYLLLPTFARPFLEALGPTIHTARGGVLMAAMTLFIVPSLILGCVSPMLVKLVFISGAKVGTTTGTLYAIGSFGNVLGILVTDYVLLVTFNLNNNIYGMGVVLVLVGIAHLAIPISVVDNAKAVKIPQEPEEPKAEASTVEAASS